MSDQTLTNLSRLTRRLRQLADLHEGELIRAEFLSAAQRIDRLELDVIDLRRQLRQQAADYAALRNVAAHTHGWLVRMDMYVPSRYELARALTADHPGAGLLSAVQRVLSAADEGARAVELLALARLVACPDEPPVPAAPIPLPPARLSCARCGEPLDGAGWHMMQRGAEIIQVCGGCWERTAADGYAEVERS